MRPSATKLHSCEQESTEYSSHAEKEKNKLLMLSIIHKLLTNESAIKSLMSACN